MVTKADKLDCFKNSIMPNWRAAKPEAVTKRWNVYIRRMHRDLPEGHRLRPTSKQVAAWVNAI